MDLRARGSIKPRAVGVGGGKTSSMMLERGCGPRRNDLRRVRERSAPAQLVLFEVLAETRYRLSPLPGPAVFVLVSNLSWAVLFHLRHFWGRDRAGDQRPKRTMKMIIYTLRWSMLMLVARSPRDPSPPAGTASTSRWPPTCAAQPPPRAGSQSGSSPFSADASW